MPQWNSLFGENMFACILRFFIPTTILFFYILSKVLLVSPENVYSKLLFKILNIQPRNGFVMWCTVLQCMFLQCKIMIISIQWEKNHNINKAFFNLGPQRTYWFLSKHVSFIWHICIFEKNSLYDWLHVFKSVFKVSY